MGEERRGFLLERVVLLEAVDRPLGLGGQSPSTEKIFESSGKHGRPGYDLRCDYPWILITDLVSGEEEMVHVSLLRSMRRARARAAKAAGVK
jgi:hypothetical protein